MKVEVSKCNVSNTQIDELFNRILKEAESCADEYQGDKENLFNQGMAQAYTEVIDNIQYWAEANGIDLHVDLEHWVTEKLG